MNEIILEKLRQTEQSENVKILLAVESGSRAWGFASPDSDYDVRFIYARPVSDYLRLEKIRDVIELPIEGEFDINGWDLQKTLRLIYKSNPTVFEWLNAPIVYLKNDFAAEINTVAKDYFSVKKALYHYLNMAVHNYKAYLKEDYVKAKNYFYVLRAILACKWLLDKGTPPPVSFSELAESELDDTVKAEVKKLLDLKMNCPEIYVIPKIRILHEYLEINIESIRKQIDDIPNVKSKDWNNLNELFQKIVYCQQE